MNDSSANTCPICGTPLDAESAGGCPRCLMLAAMEPTSHSGSGGRSPAPTLAEVQSAFPQLEILDLIGQGGMGCVFKARQPKLNRLVALKLLPASLAERDPAFTGRFEREGQLLARLHHPNIVAVHDSGTAGPFFYLIMEYVDGVNLRQAMRTRRFTPSQALAIVPHICDALQFAHDEGVLHRDIKPENILLDSKGRVKLADFGIAKLLAEPDTLVPGTSPSDSGFTHAGATLGTPSYMAPEQRDTPDDVDNRADIYSLGVVFYELLTGELPTGKFAPPSSKTDSDSRVDAIVAQALERERTRRQRSAGELKTQVENVTSSASTSADQKRLRPFLIAIVALGLLVAGATAPSLSTSLFFVSVFCFLIAIVFINPARREQLGETWSKALVIAPLAVITIISLLIVGRQIGAAQRAEIQQKKAVASAREPRRGSNLEASNGDESWSYTPRYSSPEKIADWSKSPQAANAGWNSEMSLSQKAGVVTLSGPRERVRRLATVMRVFDQPEAKSMFDLPLMNMPPEFFVRISLPGLMSQSDYARHQLTDSLLETLNRERVAATQLGRALSSHVLELEKASFINTGTPFENIVHSPGASTDYEVTIPCADQPEKPLTLRVERTTQQMGTQSRFAAFAPWLIEEAKQLPRVASLASTEPSRTLEMDAATLTSTKGKLWRSAPVDLTLREGKRTQEMLVMEFAPFDREGRTNPPQAQVKLSVTTVPQGPLQVSSTLGTADFEDVRLEEKDGARTMTITRAIETVSRPDKNTERALKKFFSSTFTYEFEGDSLILGGFPEGPTDWGVATFTVSERKIAFMLNP